MSCEADGFKRIKNTLRSILSITQPLGQDDLKRSLKETVNQDKRVTKGQVLPEEGQKKKSPEEVLEYNESNVSDILIKNATIDCTSDTMPTKPKGGYPKVI